jgi:hypothetical protein
VLFLSQLVRITEVFELVAELSAVACDVAVLFMIKPSIRGILEITSANFSVFSLDRRRFSAPD